MPHADAREFLRGLLERKESKDACADSASPEGSPFYGKAAFLTHR